MKYSRSPDISRPNCTFCHMLSPHRLYLLARMYPQGKWKCPVGGGEDTDADSEILKACARCGILQPQMKVTIYTILSRLLTSLG